MKQNDKLEIKQGTKDSAVISNTEVDLVTPYAKMILKDNDSLKKDNATLIEKVTLLDKELKNAFEVRDIAISNDHESQQKKERLKNEADALVLEIEYLKTVLRTMTDIFNTTLTSLKDNHALLGSLHRNTEYSIRDIDSVVDEFNKKTMNKG